MTNTDKNHANQLVRNLKKKYSPEELSERFLDRTLDTIFAEIGALIDHRPLDPHIHVFIGYERVKGYSVPMEV